MKALHIFRIMNQNTIISKKAAENVMMMFVCSSLEKKIMFSSKEVANAMAHL